MQFVGCQWRDDLLVYPGSSGSPQFGQHATCLQRFLNGTGRATVATLSRGGGFDDSCRTIVI